MPPSVLKLALLLQDNKQGHGCYPPPQKQVATKKKVQVSLVILVT